LAKAVASRVEFCNTCSMDPGDEENGDLEQEAKPTHDEDAIDWVALLRSVWPTCNTETCPSVSSVECGFHAQAGVCRLSWTRRPLRTFSCSKRTSSRQSQRWPKNRFENLFDGIYFICLFILLPVARPRAMNEMHVCSALGFMLSSQLNREREELAHALSC
jgi:hypothetical protein